MKNIKIFATLLSGLLVLLNSVESLAVNVQQFSRSNSLTFEMIEDARLSSSHVVNHYKWLLNFGVSYVDQPLTLKNSQNTEQVDSVVDSMMSIHLGVAYYIKPYWQIAANTSFSQFENNLGETISDFQDLDIRTKIRLFNGRRSAFTIMPIAFLPSRGGETEIRDNASPPVSYGRDQLLSDTGFGLGVFGIYEYLFRNFQVSLNLGYRINSHAKFVDSFGATQIDKTELLTAGLGVYYPFHKKVGLNVEFLSNYTAPLFNKDINPTELYVGLSSGVVENIHAFVGAGFGNLFSNSDGNDYRVVAGFKFTPGTKAKKDYSRLEETIKPTRVIEDDKAFCKGAYLFDDTNSVTVLFPNNSDTISKKQEEQLLEILTIYNARKDDIALVRIYGHTSKPGDEAYNQLLGQKRAKRIKSFFIENRVDNKLLSEVKSKGETAPIFENKENSPKFNRRSEIEFVMSDRYRGCYE